jgi:tetratricopeptide (TPR) repeat protein
MKGIYSLMVLSVVVFLSGCGGAFQSAGQMEQGKQAMFEGNNKLALAYFQEAAQTDPNGVWGATLRLGIFTLLGQAQYLNGDYAQARQTLQKSLSMHPSDHVARLYLGLTQARLEDRQAGLKNIEAAMSGIASFLNYITSTFRYSFGVYWDPSGNIRSSIKGYLATISSGNIDWPQLIADGERLGIRIEEEEEKAREQQQQQPFVGP